MSNLAHTSQELLDLLGLEQSDINLEGQKIADAGGGSGYIADPDDTILRQMGAGGKRKPHALTGGINWFFPEQPDEIWRAVHAIRGFVIKSKNGLQYWPAYDAASNGTNKPICSSVGCVYGDLTLKGDKPYPFPEFKYPAEYGQPVNLPLRGMQEKYQLHGRRGQSCADCVASGNHEVRETVINEKGQQVQMAKQRCSLASSVVFAVTEYAIHNPKTGLVWKPITEFPSPDDVNTYLYSHPVIININMSMSAYYDNPAVLTEANSKGSYVPNDVKTFREFWKSVAAKKLLVSINDPITPVYWLTEAEFYLAQPDKSAEPNRQAKTPTVPVFRIANEGALVKDPEKLGKFKEVIQQYHQLISDYIDTTGFDIGGKSSEVKGFVSSGVTSPDQPRLVQAEEVTKDTSTLESNGYSEPKLNLNVTRG